MGFMSILPIESSGKTATKLCFCHHSIWFIHLFSPIDMMYNHTMYCCVAVICWVRHVPEMWIQNVTELMIYRPWEAGPAGTPNGRKKKKVVKICCCFFDVSFNAGWLHGSNTTLSEVRRTVCVPGTPPPMSNSVQSNLICACGKLTTAVPKQAWIL